MHERLRQWVIEAADRPRAKTALFWVAFAESSVFPIPPDTLLAPIVLRRPHAWLSLTLLCTAGSVLGGVAGYAIGYFLVDSAGAWLMHGYGFERGLERFRALFLEYGAFIILAKGLTPIPYKLITIASGAAHFPIPAFIGLSIVTRAARFALVAASMRFLKPRARHYVEKNLLLVMVIFLAVAGVGSTLALHAF